MLVMLQGWEEHLRNLHTRARAHRLHAENPATGLGLGSEPRDCGKVPEHLAAQSAGPGTTAPGEG